MGATEARSDRWAPLLIAAFLTSIAGFVDAVGFLTFARIYTANMSGNSVAVGIAFSQYDWANFLLRFWPILLYVCGLIVGRLLIEIGARRGTRCIASIALACEISLLVIVILFDTPANARSSEWQYVAIAMLAAAMGIQNAALTRFSSLTVNTGFVTGTLVKLSEQFVACATFLWDMRSRGKPLPKAFSELRGHRSFRVGAFLALTWTAYVVGAILGAWAKSTAQARALLLPVGGLMLLIAFDLYKPLGLQDEREQDQLE